jgi:hypothetical protein
VAAADQDRGLGPSLRLGCAATRHRIEQKRAAPGSGGPPLRFGSSSVKSVFASSLAAGSNQVGWEEDLRASAAARRRTGHA